MTTLQKKVKTLQKKSENPLQVQDPTNTTKATTTEHEQSLTVEAEAKPEESATEITTTNEEGWSTTTTMTTTLVPIEFIVFALFILFSLAVAVTGLYMCCLYMKQQHYIIPVRNSEEATNSKI